MYAVTYPTAHTHRGRASRVPVGRQGCYIGRSLPVANPRAIYRPLPPPLPFPPPLPLPLPLPRPLPPEWRLLDSC